jgi:hypothetical protein
MALLSREDLLKYREWWISRIKRDEVTAVTANKNIVLMKTIIETVNDNCSGLDTRHLFKKLILPEHNQTRCLPFESDYILSTLLIRKPERIGMNRSVGCCMQ